MIIFKRTDYDIVSEKKRNSRIHIFTKNYSFFFCIVPLDALADANLAKKSKVGMRNKRIIVLDRPSYSSDFHS